MVMNIRHSLGKAWRAVFGPLCDQYQRCLGREVNASIGSLLDVGCGFNSPVQHLGTRPTRLVGIDAFAPAIQESRLRNIHDEYCVMNVLEIGQNFGPRSFDCVLASDVIEHLAESDALSLIQQMETIARKTVIIYTPNGFLPQGEKYGNPLQRHLSGWTAARMQQMGYQVIGIDGWRPLRGEQARIKWWPRLFWLSVSLLSQLIVTTRPRWAFRILCVRDVWARSSRA
jgi:SAM-dependent methyltransferase